MINGSVLINCGKVIAKFKSFTTTTVKTSEVEDDANPPTKIFATIQTLKDALTTGDGTCANGIRRAHHVLSKTRRLLTHLRQLPEFESRYKAVHVPHTAY